MKIKPKRKKRFTKTSKEARKVRATLKHTKFLSDEEIFGTDNK